VTTPRRTLQDIRTHAGGGGGAKPGAVYTVYLKIAMLEIERERLTKDHADATARVARTAERMRQIDEIIRALRATMTEEDAKPERAPADRPSAAAGRRRTFRF
jgi:hypothetical protein